MINSLKMLFKKINVMLKDKKLEELRYLLKEYNGKDWYNYVKYNNKKYNKNIAFKNDLCEIVIISWDYNQISPIHDHPSKGCLLKILKGMLIEENYINNNGNIIKDDIKIMTEQDIGYKIGNKTLHKIKNGNIRSVSLHIYSPSNHNIKIYI
jgi:cysteine dioxygenase